MIQIQWKDGAVTEIADYRASWFTGAGQDWLAVQFTSGERVFYRSDAILRVHFFEPELKPEPKTQNEQR